jgi:hypothetical protein
MKVRVGFISNSSSTSFIAVTDHINTSVPVGGTKFTLEDFGDKLTSMKELIAWIHDNWINFTDDEDIEDQLSKSYDENCVSNFRKMKDAIESGRAIVVGSFSDENGDGVETDLRGGDWNCYIDKIDAELIGYVSD